jgi:hypothetical protein
MLIVSSYITGEQEQSSPGSSGINSSHPQVGTAEDAEPTVITTAVMQDSINEGTLSNSSSNSAVLQQSSEQPQCGETSHGPCSAVDTA